MLFKSAIAERRNDRKCSSFFHRHTLFFG